MRVKKWAAITAVVAVMSTVAACGSDSTSSTSGSAGAAAEDSVFTVAVTAVPQKWDPYQQDWASLQQSGQMVYATLVQQEQDGSLGPGLAESWSYSDPTHFQLKLKSGLTFSDGEPVDAAAVKANLDRAKTVTGPKTSQLAAVQTVTATDPTTVDVTLSTPNPSLPFILSQVMGMVASPKALADQTALDAAPVGAGPYTLDVDNTTPGDTYTFVKNPTYWNAANVGIQTVVFKVIADTTASVNAFKSGQVDATVGTANDVSSIPSVEGGVSIQQLSYFASLNLQDRNGTQVPALGSEQVRQAMNYAVDRTALQAVIGEGQIATQIFMPGSGAYDASLDNAYPYDPDKAKQLLASAGYPDGFDLTVTSTDYGNFLTYTQAVAEQLGKVGIRVQINNLPLKDYLTAKFTTTNPAYAWFFNASDAYLDVEQILLTESHFNPYKVTTPEIESLFATAQTQTGDAVDATLKQVSKVTVDQGTMLVTNYVNTYYFYNNTKVKDLNFIPLIPLPPLTALQPAG